MITYAALLALSITNLRVSIHKTKWPVVETGIFSLQSTGPAPERIPATVEDHQKNVNATRKQQKESWGNSDAGCAYSPSRSRPASQP